MPTPYLQRTTAALLGKDADSACILLSIQVNNPSEMKVVHLLSAMHGIEEVPCYSSANTAMLQFYISTKFGD